MDFDAPKTSEFLPAETPAGELTLPLSNSYFKTLFHHLLFPAAILQPDGALHFANTSFLKFLGLDRPNLLKTNLQGRMTVASAKQLDELLTGETLMQETRPVSIRCAFINSKQEVVEAELTLKWIAEIEGILAIIEKVKSASRDVEARKKRPEELENLFYIISHNLKSPIVSIQGFVKLLLESPDSKFSPQQLHFIERIQKNATRLNEMVQDVLQFSRLTQRTPHWEMVSLSQILNNIKVESFFRLKEKNISLKIADDLPEIKADVEDISGIFQNLIDNAIKYVGKTSEPEIQVGWERRPRFHVFWVSDNGPGIPQKAQDSLFKMFERANSTGEVEGAGMGLAIVKGIVEKYGGQVKLTSEPGLGTKVYFTIPV